MKRLLKYTIAFLVVIMLVPMTTNAQTIKRQKPITEQTSRPKQKAEQTPKPKQKQERLKATKSQQSTNKEVLQQPSYELEYISPKVDLYSSSSLNVESVKMNNKQTAITFSFNNSVSHAAWMQIDPKAFIVAKGKKYFLKKAEGITISPQKTEFAYVGQTLTFTLFFPAIPASTSQIDFVESEDSEWRVYGIRLPSSSPSNFRSSSYQSIPRNTQPNKSASYNVSFSCNIRNASLYIDGKYMGNANGQYNLKEGSYFVRIVASDYIIHTAVIRIPSSTRFHYDLIKK